MSENKEIRVVVKSPFCDPEVKIIKNDYESVSKVVDGYIERIHIEKDLDLWLNEEGKLIPLEPNIDLGYDVVFGTIFVASSNAEGETIGLTDDDIDYALRFLRSHAIPKTAKDRYKPDDFCRIEFRVLD